MVDGKIISQAGVPRVVTITMNKGGQHTFGVAAVYNGKASSPATKELEINL